MTIICVPLIDRLGRKPLLVYPMVLIVINFILMTVFLHYQVIKELLFFSLKIGFRKFKQKNLNSKGRLLVFHLFECYMCYGIHLLFCYWTRTYPIYLRG